MKRKHILALQKIGINHKELLKRARDYGLDVSVDDNPLYIIFSSSRGQSWAYPKTKIGDTTPYGWEIFSPHGETLIAALEVMAPWWS